MKLSRKPVERGVMLRLYLGFIMLILSAPAHAECYFASPWRMGDATENTYHGKLARVAGGFEITTPPQDDRADEKAAFFQLGADVDLPPGVYAIRYKVTQNGTPVSVTQAIGSAQLGLSLDKPYPSMTLTVDKPSRATITIRREGAAGTQSIVTGAYFCADRWASLVASGKVVSNWKDQALTFLREPANKNGFLDPSRLGKHPDLRCIKLNNYWCLKDMGWDGRLGHDGDMHTGFAWALAGARAAVRNFKTAYLTHGRKSALAILSIYSPSSDCKGSNAARLADGSCAKGYNDSTEAAKSAARTLTDDLNADLGLFDANGVATDALVTFLGNLSEQETGLRASDALIRTGILMEREF